jgi:hypothetical protein
MTDFRTRLYRRVSFCDFQQGNVGSDQLFGALGSRILVASKFVIFHPPF